MPAKHNDTVRTDINAMLSAWIIKPVTIPCRVPVVVSKTKDGTARFFVDYQALNKILKLANFY